MSIFIALYWREVVMRPLELQSERFGATGNILAAGALNQLGRPALDSLAVMLREAVQNSWDARLPESRTVEFGITGYNLKRNQLDFLQGTVFKSMPSNLALANIMRSRTPLSILAIYDRGTTGLAGPTRADEFTPEGETSNFVDFLRNIGQAEGRRFGGGTYGYGKAAFYSLSGAGTICVHTRCRLSGRLESRFMAAALGPAYESRGGRERGRFTGRHWWGRRQADNIVGPALASEADAIARALGMPSFRSGETGTTIMIIAPRLGERTPEQAMHFLISNILWYFWPKMLSSNSGEPAMQFSLSWAGNEFAVPEPYDFPPLQGFARAMELLKGKDTSAVLGGSTTDIRSYRPVQTLGRLSLIKFPVSERRPLDTGEDEALEPVPGLCHHVALMRNAELVVKYIEGPPLPTAHVEYAGVFITDREVDHVFAKAEPPTHDDWIPSTLENATERTYVNVAKRRIRESLNDFTAPPEAVTERQADFPMGAFAEKLGGLLPGEEEPGASVQPSVPPASGARSRGSSGPVGTRTSQARIEALSEGRLVLFKGAPAVIIDFRVHHVKGTRGTSVSAGTVVLIQDGSTVETEPPAGGNVPRVIRWNSAGGGVLGTEPTAFIPSAVSAASVTVSVPRDGKVRISLEAKHSVKA